MNVFSAPLPSINWVPLATLYNVSVIQSGWNEHKQVYFVGNRRHKKGKMDHFTFNSTRIFAWGEDSILRHFPRPYLPYVGQNHQPLVLKQDLKTVFIYSSVFLSISLKRGVRKKSGKEHYICIFQRLWSAFKLLHFIKNWLLGKNTKVLKCGHHKLKIAWHFQTAFSSTFSSYLYSKNN